MLHGVRVPPLACPAGNIYFYLLSARTIKNAHQFNVGVILLNQTI